MTQNHFYVTTPIYYLNGVPHIGHAYTTIAADVLARHHRQLGYESFMLTGTDEHGQKVVKAAQEQGQDPLQFTDSIADVFETLWKQLDVDYSDFIRTTQERHQKNVIWFLDTLYAQGDIYSGEYEGWYCVPCESFFPDSQLQAGQCPDCGRSVEKLKEKSYFFKLSKYQDWLQQYLRQTECVVPNTRLNEVLSFLKNPLEDLCISRPKTRLEWGIPLPFDSEHVTYVWFDALVNYISAVKEPQERFQQFWPCDVHLIGKDIIRPHAVYWLIMLHAMKLPLPRKIFVHGWWTIAGEKMSKSKGNVVDPTSLVQEFGLDAFRYFLLREVPFGQDGTFSRTAVINRINNELANDLGNFVSRTLGMLQRYCQGLTPLLRDIDPASPEACIQQHFEDTFWNVCAAMNAVAFATALDHIWAHLRQLNRYVEEQAPWVLAKQADKRADLEQVLAFLLHSSLAVSFLIAPFMPQTAHKIQEQLQSTYPHLPCQLTATPKVIQDQFTPEWPSQQQRQDFAHWVKSHMVIPEGIHIQNREVLFPKLELESE